MLDVESWPLRKGKKTQYYQGCPSRINAHWSSNFSNASHWDKVWNLFLFEQNTFFYWTEILFWNLLWSFSFETGQIFATSKCRTQSSTMVIFFIFTRIDSQPRSHISFLASQIPRTGTFDTCVTGARPGPSWKTGSRINYHQSGDELLEYIITNMSNTIPWTELNLPLNEDWKCVLLTVQQKLSFCE